MMSVNVRKVESRLPVVRSRILMVPPCSTTNRRLASPRGAVRKTGEFRLLEIGWSFRLVRVGVVFWVSLSLPQAARRPVRHRQRIVLKIIVVMHKPLFYLPDTSNLTTRSSGKSLLSLTWEHFVVDWVKP